MCIRDSLTDCRLRTAILYVESDNRPALRLYRGLGFETEFTNRSYQRIIR